MVPRINPFRVSLSRTVTFTGIDVRTDIGRLCAIQRQYPTAEFGLLAATSRQGIENRYPDLILLDQLAGRGLRLSLHVCGSLVRRTVQDGFSTLDPILLRHKGLFRRVQLNIANWDGVPERFTVDAPAFLDEVIIQQHPGKELLARRVATSSVPVSVLIDASGGIGLEADFSNPAYRIQKGHRTGFAGGINPGNAADRLRQIQSGNPDGDWWIDMENGVRTDDWFDLDKVEQTLEALTKTLQP